MELTLQKKDTKVVPKLRFKEFTGEWEFTKMENLYPKIRNGFVGVATPFYCNDGVKYLQGKNIKNNSIKPDGLIYITKEFHEKKVNSKININDILMVQSGHVGECAVVTKEYQDSNCHALLVATPNNKPDSNFYTYYFYTNNGFKKISKITTGNTIKHILSTDLKTILVPYPKLKEQKKIATFLTAVDKKIGQLQQKKTLLEQYKKGVMQQIFSQELRFKDDDGNAYPEWEEKKLGEVATKESSNISANKIEENFGEYKIYGASGFLKNIDFYREEEPYISIVKDGAGVGRTLLCDTKSSV